MAFEELQDQLKDKWQEFKVQLDDSAAFNTLKERFETLNPNAQKLIIWSGILVFTFSLFSCPYSYYSSSSNYVAEYETTRDMIRDLLKASHLANQIGSTPPPLGEDQIRSQINRIIVDARLLPDQNLSIETLDASSFGRPLAPKQINQEGWLVKLSQLNTSQIVEVGHQLQNMHAGIKLAGMDLNANSSDPKYYDANFRLIKFFMPVKEADDDQPGSNRRGRDN